MPKPRSDPHKFISRIPLALFEAFEQRAKGEGISVNALLVRALEQFLDGGNDDIKDDGITDISRSEVISEVMARLDAVEELFARVDHIEAALEGLTLPTHPPTPPVAAAKTNDLSRDAIVPDGQRWLNTGDAYTVAASKGYGPSQSTFRRDLRDWRETGRPPARLAALGMQANLPVRAAANDKDNSVCWLRFAD